MATAIATRSAVIHRSGPLMCVSGGDGESLPRDVLRLIEGQLVYTHRHYEHGGRGRGASVRYENRRMFQYDGKGRLICQVGWLQRIVRTLKLRGYEVDVVRDDPPLDRPDCYEQDWDALAAGFEFRKYQDVCIANIAASERGVIDAVPAFGKMWIIWMVCVLYPKAKIDIITRRRDVVASIRNLGIRWVPNVGQIGGGKRIEGRVTVFTADSLHHNLFDADIVLVDEVHEMMTDRYVKLLSRYQHARMYGFTATVATRADNAHARMEAIFGPTIFKISHAEAVRAGLVVPMIVKWLGIDADCNPIAHLQSSTAKKRHGIWRNAARNEAIAEAAKSFVDRGLQTLILVDTFEHMLFLRRLLPEFICCYSEGVSQERMATWRRMGLLSDDEPRMTAQRRESLRVAFEERRILGAIATGVWAVGVSFNSLQVLIRAAGGVSKTNSIQMPGRVGRIDEKTGKKAGILVDCMDYFDNGMLQQSLARRRIYAGEGWSQYMPDGTLWTPKRYGK